MNRRRFFSFGGAAVAVAAAASTKPAAEASLPAVPEVGLPGPMAASERSDAIARRAAFDEIRSLSASTEGRFPWEWIVDRLRLLRVDSLKYSHATGNLDEMLVVFTVDQPEHTVDQEFVASRLSELKVQMIDCFSSKDRASVCVKGVLPPPKPVVVKAEALGDGQRQPANCRQKLLTRILESEGPRPVGFTTLDSPNIFLKTDTVYSKELFSNDSLAALEKSIGDLEKAAAKAVGDAWAQHPNGLVNFQVS